MAFIRHDTLRSWAVGLLLCVGLFFVCVANSLAAPVRYIEQAADNHRIYVVSYDDLLTVAVDGSEPILVARGTRFEIIGNAGTRTITLSSEKGYVFTMDPTIDNESDDRLILMRGENSYTDTHFYIYNPLPAQVDSPSSGDPGKAVGARLFITAAKSGLVTVTDLTDGSDTDTPHGMNAQSTYVKTLSGPGMLEISSETPVTVALGLVDNGHWEVMPNIAGALVGFDATVPTTGNVGVMPVGDGDLQISRLFTIPGVGSVNRETLFQGAVTAGEAIFVRGLIPDDSGLGEYQGTSTVQIKGSAPFYSWSGREGNEDASYIPHDPTQAAGTHYYLTPHHIEYSSKVLVTAFDAAVVTLTEIGGSEITPEAGSTTLAVGDTVVYQLAAPGDPDNDRRVNVGYELNSTGAVSVLMGQPGSDARGYLVLSPDYNPPVPPQIANFEVRRIVTALANGGSTDSARVWVDVTDFDGDLNSWTISHEGMEIIIQKGDPRVTVDDGTHLKFGPIDLGITIEPHADGLFALMVSDAAGANVVALDQVRKLSDANVTSVTPYEPLVDAKEVVVSPFFSWSIKELATRYTYELSTDQTFAGDALLIQTSTLNNEISYRDHRTDNLDGLTTYYWRVRYDLRTVQFGIDTEVISPKWAFTTRAGPDQLPPTIAAGPMVVEFDSTLVTIAWRTDKPSKGGIAYAASNFAEGERFFVAELTMTKDHLLIIRPEGTALRYDYRVLVADAFGNEDSSAVNWFRLLETPDVIAPRLASGPGRVHASDSTATLGWSTNELAKGVLNIAIDNGSGAPDAAELFEVNDDSVLALNHLVRLKDLEADTTYYFALQLRDRKNNYRDIPLRSFRTLKTPDTLPPRIVGAVTIVRTTNSTAVIRWKTSENTTAVIRYGISDLDQGRRVPVPRDRHEAEISGLAPLTPYGYVIEITDANKNEGESSPRRTFSTRETPDNTPPSFDQRPEVIASSITQTSASLRWVTNELTTGLVEFGLFDNLPSPGFTRTINAASGTNVEIQDLSPATRYAFRVTVTDLGQNRVTYPETMTFFTKSAPDPTPAEVQGTPSVAATQTNATITFSTDKLATASVAFGTSVSYGSLAEGGLIGGLNHSKILNGLTAGTEYHYKVDLVSATQLTSSTRDLTFRTPTTADTDPPIFTSRPKQHGRGSNNSIKIKFRTNEAVTSTLYWRKVGSTAPANFKVNQIADDRITTKIKARGLDRSSSYQIMVVITDAAGLSATWPAGVELRKVAGQYFIHRIAAPPRGGGGIFTTVQNPDTTPPLITKGPFTTSSSPNGTIITWETDEPADGVVRIRPLGPSGKIARTNDNHATVDTSEQTVRETSVDETHRIVITGLGENLSYSYEVASTDDSENDGTLSDTQVFTTSGAVDITAPQITEGPTVVSRTHNQAVVTWKTDEASDTRVTFKLVGGPADNIKQETDAELVTDHTYIFTNLAPDTVYAFLPFSNDIFGNSGGGENYGGFIRTRAEPDLKEPTMSDPTIIRTDDVTAVIQWETNERSDSYVEFGTTTSYGMSQDSGTDDTLHTVTLTGLTAATTYFYRYESQDPSGNRAVLPDSVRFTFTTDGAADTVPPESPTGVVAEPGNGAVKLSWNPNSEADLGGYNVLHSTDGVNYKPVVTTLPSPQFTDITAANGTQYHYQVEAFDLSRLRNKSIPSAAVTATPDPSNAPSVPGDLYSYAGIHRYFIFFDPTIKEGWPSRPVIRIGNAAPAASRPDAKLSYEFVVAKDSSFNTIIATSVLVPEGDRILGAFPFYLIPSIDSIAPEPDTTSWIATADMVWGTHYWKVRAYDGEFFGPFSQTHVLSGASSFFPVPPDHATNNCIFPKPEEGLRVAKCTANQDMPMDTLEVAISLSSFTALSVANGIEINWRASERDGLAGYHLWRGNDDKYTRVTDRIIAPTSVGQFIDMGVIPGREYSYKLEAVADAGVANWFGPVTGQAALPATFSLGQNIPNPFNPSTTIAFAVAEKSDVRLSIHNMVGQHVATLVDGVTNAGFHRVRWDGDDGQGRHASSGVYFYRITFKPESGAARTTLTKRMLLVR